MYMTLESFVHCEYRGLHLGGGNKEMRTEFWRGNFTEILNSENEDGTKLYTPGFLEEDRNLKSKEMYQILRVKT